MIGLLPMALFFVCIFSCSVDKRNAYCIFLSVKGKIGKKWLCTAVSRHGTGNRLVFFFFFFFFFGFFVVVDLFFVLFCFVFAQYWLKLVRTVELDAWNVFNCKHYKMEIKAFAIINYDIQDMMFEMNRQHIKCSPKWFQCCCIGKVWLKLIIAIATCTRSKEQGQLP